VRKIIDDQPDGVDKVRLTVPVIYARIRGSNSSLNRKPKKLLEDSLERVLEVVKSDLFGDEEEDSVEGDFEGLEEPPAVVCKVHAEKLSRTGILIWFISIIGAQWREPKHCRRMGDTNGPETNPSTEIRVNEYIQNLEATNTRQ
jgi:hypothetical protein